MKLYSFFLFLLFTLALVSCQPTTIVESFPQGYTIVEAQQPILKINENHTYYFFVYNASNGKLINNTVANCSYYLANETGTLLINGSSAFQPNGYWKYEIDKSFFDNSGFYPYGVNCQNDFGGALAGTLEVTYTGTTLTIQESILYLGMVLILILSFVLNIVGIFFLPSSNEVGERGEILSISYLKYLRLPLWITAYFILVAIFYTTSSISIAYFYDNMFGNILFTIFSILLGLSPLIITVIFVSFFIRIYQDKEMKQYIERGFNMGGQV